MPWSSHPTPVVETPRPGRPDVLFQRSLEAATRTSKHPDVTDAVSTLTLPGVNVCRTEDMPVVRIPTPLTHARASMIASRPRERPSARSSARLGTTYPDAPRSASSTATSCGGSSMFM